VTDDEQQKRVTHQQLLVAVAARSSEVLLRFANECQPQVSFLEVGDILLGAACGMADGIERAKGKGGDRKAQPLEAMTPTEHERMFVQHCNNLIGLAERLIAQNPHPADFGKWDIGRGFLLVAVGLMSGGGKSDEELAAHLHTLASEILAGDRDPTDLMAAEPGGHA
jgi:hypothetical protein